MTHSRDWLVTYTDQELMVIRKIFENKTNQIIGDELGLSSKSINLKILSIFKKMGVRTGLASKNLILYHFGTRFAAHLPAIKAFEIPPPAPSISQLQNDERKIDKQIIESQNAAKIDFILEHGGTGRYGPSASANDAHEKYTRERLLCVNQNYLDKIFKRVQEEVANKEAERINMEQLTQSTPVLPFGHNQCNGISYAKITSSNKSRILLLFPASQHKWSQNDKSE